VRRALSFSITLVIASLLLVAGCGGSSDSAPDHVTKLKLGDTAVLKGSNGKHKVNVVVDATEGKPDDLKDFRLSAGEKKMTPWYVTTTVTNAGDEVTASDPVPVVDEPRDDTGAKAKELSLLGDFPRCKLVNVPDPLPAKATNTSCSVYLVKDGHELDFVDVTETRFNGANQVFSWKVA
jgi:hypothetical protein